MVADELAAALGSLGRARTRFRAALARGAPARRRCRRLRRVALLWPQTYMNDAGRSVGPARGSYKLALERVLVVHDEIDLPFGEVRSRLGGGLAGHNGLKSLKRELGGARLQARARRRRASGLDRPGDRLRLRAGPLQRAAASRSPS